MAVEPFAEVALHMRGFQVSQLVFVAAKLRLADRVGDGRTIAELAADSSAHPEMLLRLCRALAAFGIFAVDDAGRVTQTHQSACLRSDASPTLHYAALYWSLPSTWAAWSNLHHTIVTGEPAFEATFGMPNFEYLKANPEQGAVFDEFMRHSPDDRHAAVAAAYDFSGAGIVVDIGGGSGGLLRAILDAHTDVRGILADQAGIVAGAAQTLGPQADRCEVMAIDFFARVPKGGDIYSMAQILHDWNDESCLKILANCRAAMNPGGRLLVIERVLETLSGRSLPMNFLSDMNMMVLFPGAKERTLAEFSRLFRESGLREPQIIPTRSPYSILETCLA
ncbi:methyltransferase [Mesorhizobium caraganae]|uniref:methyltransferase n=1 Tax=Mesorhizobium caraganae TaxID=483206 RepID=UPI001939F5DD|nr:methyltransferase [Mesorhizobium caraganae]MBM2709636.1 methyltransferase [Mesorhizobium caraganae]